MGGGGGDREEREEGGREGGGNPNPLGPLRKEKEDQAWHCGPPRDQEVSESHRSPNP